MSSVRIHYELRDLDSVEPWGRDQPHLHWFGLTDGWYDLRIDGSALFEPLDGVGRGVDYYVVRLWEDLIDVAAPALREVPAPLAARLERGDAWRAWTERVYECEGLDSSLVDHAFGWWSDRHVDTGYLRGAPRLDLWRSGEHLHVQWRSLQHEADDPRWSSPQGDAVVPIQDFHAELVGFDRGFLAAMKRRVDAITESWTRSIEIDVAELQREHTDRERWLARALSSTLHRDNWEKVISAIEALERRVVPV